MRHVKMTVCEWEEVGELGFVPHIFKNWESYRPGRGLGHDLLEHSTKETGEIYQELRALGGWMYVRDFTMNTPIGALHRRQGGILKALQQTGELVSSDLVNIYRDIEEFGGDESIPEIAPRRFSKGMEQKFKAVFNAFRDSVIKTWDAENFNDEGEFTCPYADKLDLIEAWIREGYYQARKRYKGEYVYHVFEAINREGEKFFQNNHVEEGDVVTLSYNLDGHCEIKAHNERWY